MCDRSKLKELCDNSQPGTQKIAITYFRFVFGIFEELCKPHTNTPNELIFQITQNTKNKSSYLFHLSKLQSAL